MQSASYDADASVNSVQWLKKVVLFLISTILN